MKKLRKTLAVLLMVAIAFSLCGYTLPDNPEDGNLPAIAEGDSMDVNYGTVEVNDGSIETNRGKVTDNNGDIANNNGTVTYNAGDVAVNDNVVKNNTGNVETNKWRVEQNKGTIGENTAWGMVEVNDGTIETNTWLVGDNYGEIGKNIFLVNNNYGTVADNEGAGVIMNYETGCVNGGIVSKNLGGTVSEGTIVQGQYYLLDTTEADCSAAAVDGESEQGTEGKVYGESGGSAQLSIANREGYDVVAEQAGDTELLGWQSGYVWNYIVSNLSNNVFFRYIRNANPTLADEYSGANGKWAAMIRNADQNATVEIDAGPWTSFNVDVAAAISERSDVKVIFSGEGVEGGSLTIPAGTEMLKVFGDNGVMSFADIAKAI